MEIKPIARFRSPFSSKFGIPKQAGLVAELEGQIVLNPNIAIRIPQRNGRFRFSLAYLGVFGK